MLLPAQVRMARAGLGWSLLDLAERAQINPNTVSRYERGAEVRSGVLQKIEAVFRAEGIVFFDDGVEAGIKVPQKKLA